MLAALVENKVNIGHGRLREAPTRREGGRGRCEVVKGKVRKSFSVIWVFLFFSFLMSFFSPYFFLFLLAIFFLLSSFPPFHTRHHHLPSLFLILHLVIFLYVFSILRRYRRRRLPLPLSPPSWRTYLFSSSLEWPSGNRYKKKTFHENRITFRFLVSGMKWTLLSTRKRFNLFRMA